MPNLDSDDYQVVKDAKAAIQGLVEEAMNRAGQNERAELGTYVHGLTELVDRGEELPSDVSPKVRADLDAYWKATREFEMLDIESFVVCDELEVAGTFDRRVRYNGRNYIFDLKTSTSTDFAGTKFGVQLATYAHGTPYDLDSVFKLSIEDYKAGNFEGDFRQAWDEPVDQDWGILLHLPAGEARAVPKWIDLREGWKCAKLSQTIRQQRRFKKWYSPMDITSVEESSPYAVRSVEHFLGQVAMSPVVDHLYVIHADAKAAGYDITAACAARKVELLGSR